MIHGQRNIKLEFPVTDSPLQNLKKADKCTGSDPGPRRHFQNEVSKQK